MPMKERMAGPMGAGILSHNSGMPLVAWSNEVPVHDFAGGDDHDTEQYASAALSYVRGSHAWNLHIMWSCTRRGRSA